MKENFGRKVGVGFGSAIAALVLIGGAAWWSASRYQSTVYWVNHTHQVLNALESVQIDVLSMQANVRGFVLTGDEALLPAYQAGNTRLDRTAARLRQLTLDNRRQQARLTELQPVVTRAREIMRGRIEARRARGLDVANEGPFFRDGQKAVEELRRIIGAMESEEERLLQDRLRRLTLVGRIAVLSILGAALLGIVVLVVAARLLKREAAERALMERTARASEERLRLTIASVTDYAIIQLDASGRIASWNTGAEGIKGFVAAEIIGENFARFYPPEALELGLPERALATAAATGRFEDEGWRVRKDGSRFWAHVVINAVRDGGQTLLGYVKSTRDLTSVRAAQEKIQSLNEDLLRRASALETANQELEAFSYSVSHDLRAPLRHIDGFANLLVKDSETTLDERGKRYLATISKAARRMGELIDDLLAFSRIGRTPLRVEQIDQTQLVREVIAEARYDTAERRIAWEIGDLPATLGDRALIRQVWRNLLDNAVKYSGRNPAPCVKVQGKFNAEDQEFVFAVHDNGVGFDMEYADKLFGVFQRLHGPSEFEGTGIGLANIRRIVSRHGGRTWAEGKVDVGATFSFTLPVVPPAPTAS